VLYGWVAGGAGACVRACLHAYRESERECTRARARAHVYYRLQNSITTNNSLKGEDITQVCKNGSRLYYTPNDVNLSIEDRSGEEGKK
jgi:hypothetical protein